MAQAVETRQLTTWSEYDGRQSWKKFTLLLTVFVQPCCDYSSKRLVFYLHAFLYVLLDDGGWALRIEDLSKKWSSASICSSVSRSSSEGIVPVLVTLGSVGILASPPRYIHWSQLNRRPLIKRWFRFHFLFVDNAVPDSYPTRRTNRLKTIVLIRYQISTYIQLQSIFEFSLVSLSIFNINFLPASSHQQGDGYKIKNRASKPTG